MRILCVEDNKTFGELLSAFLTKSGHAVTLARSGEEAMDLLQTGEHFDAILSDLIMPGMDGLQFFRAIKHYRWTAKVPKLLLTGYLGMIWDHREAKAVCDAVLEKRASLEEVEATLTRLLAELG